MASAAREVEYELCGGRKVSRKVGRGHIMQGLLGPGRNLGFILSPFSVRAQMTRGQSRSKVTSQAPTVVQVREELLGPGPQPWN